MKRGSSPPLLYSSAKGTAFQFLSQGNKLCVYLPLCLCLNNFNIQNGVRLAQLRGTPTPLSLLVPRAGAAFPGHAMGTVPNQSYEMR